jgi:signal transduction histidine kinase
VLVNLLDNAIKYSPDGGDVTVELAGGAARACLTVRDGGLGIPTAEQERIFEKFYRLDPALTRGVGGSGLGLYISRELVSRMGGTLTVRSEPGVGAAFVVDLPAA